MKDYTDRGLDAPYDPTKKDQSLWTFEPHVAMRVTKQMLDEAGVTVLTEHYLKSVTKEGPRITSLLTKKGNFRARVFVDGTYEGDLMAAADVDWTIGREGRKEHGESLAGKQYTKRKMNIDGFDDAGNLLPLITTDNRGDEELGDRNIMTYSFRLCLTADQTTVCRCLSQTTTMRIDSKSFAVRSRLERNKSALTSTRCLVINSTGTTPSVDSFRWV